jgi:hypothetical protein
LAGTGVECAAQPASESAASARATRADIAN